jgi:hypothetical protein
MKLKISCFDTLTNLFFQDTITFESAVLRSPEEAATALRDMYASVSPSVEVLQVVRLEEMERGDY